MMNKEAAIYWIGVRESEIAQTGTLFSGSITLYGTNEGTNFSLDKVNNARVDCNQDCDGWIAFVNRTAGQLVAKDTSCRFMLYYSPEATDFSEEIQCRIICVNDLDMIMLLENKIRTRLWLQEDVNIPPYCVMDGSEITYEALKSRFPSYREFVIQAGSSCGGNGTWLFNQHTQKEVCKRIESEESYTATPYIKHSIPVNIHLMIYSDEVILFPASIQLISAGADAFAYKGGDFIAYRQLSSHLQEAVSDSAQRIGQKLRLAGYRGICGVDFIVTAQDVFFMEVNSRFQASTMALNLVFAQCCPGFSMQLMHREAFERQACSLTLPLLDINYSFIFHSYNGLYHERLQYLHHLATNDATGFVTCIDDHLDWAVEYEPKAYLFQLLFSCNIAAVAPDCTCTFHPNIFVDSLPLTAEDWQMRSEELKVLLLHHGVRVSACAQQHALESGGMNQEEFEALDLHVGPYFFNVPFGTRPTQMSPFEINLNPKGQYVLCYWGNPLTVVEIRTRDPLGSESLPGGFRFEDISYLGTDRLRVYFRHSCYYKRVQLGCGFCDIEDSPRQFSFEDVKTVVDRYANHPAVRHYLIGGGSDAPDSDFSGAIRIAEYIRQTSGKPIYLMITPPRSVETLERFNSAGITEVTFNLEVFDRALARKYMPGKGAIPLSDYESAFRAAVRLWGAQGNVRTVFMVGLEPKASLLEGIKFVCQLGVAPILSLFKPVADTPLEGLYPPSDDEILDTIRKTKEICSLYGLAMGPACHCCEENTLKITSM